MADEIDQSTVAFVQATLPDALEQAGRFNGTVKVMALVTWKDNRPKDLVGYLTYPVGQQCPCCNHQPGKED